MTGFPWSKTLSGPGGFREPREMEGTGNGLCMMYSVDGSCTTYVIFLLYVYMCNTIIVR